jgi:hypothetical protein
MSQTIAKLIRLTFESQMPPTLISLAFMIEFGKLQGPLHVPSSSSVITPSSLLGAFLQGIQSKFYAVGLMYALNSRINFQQAAADTQTAGVRWSLPFQIIRADSQGQVFALSNRGPTQIQVDVETYVQVGVRPFSHRCQI